MSSYEAVHGILVVYGNWTIHAITNHTRLIPASALKTYMDVEIRQRFQMQIRSIVNSTVLH